MKIDQVNLYHLRMKLRNHFETSFGRIQTRDCILLEVFSDGITGYGECVADHDPGYSYETTQTAWHVLTEFILPTVMKTEFDNLQEFKARISKIRGHLMAKAGLEMAIWDLMGKRESQSVFQV